MAIHIPYGPPLITYRLCPCSKEFTINLHQSVSEHLKAGTELTRDTALAALRKVKWKSDAKAFFANPVVLIVTSSLILAAGIACLVVTNFIALLVLEILGYVLATAGSAALIYFIKSFSNLKSISQGYQQQSQEAQKYIALLEKSSPFIEVTIG